MKKKKSKFAEAPPIASDINEANALIEELWEQLHHYEDKLKTSCSNSSKPPSSDDPKERAERKKLKALVTAIREELNKVTQGVNDNSPN
ncbi:DUF6444 domain-containing protein [Vibrio sp. SCSIO 43132]|uniref:DUF6444 domain-containing protein n=1 Tax=Vibrio sp. SCSIO 43132 TaxID=2779363 RepID=UPI00223AD850|nr:DUF6444 domain-containing protein [Vibrio sp. SCSIO 43132]